MQYLSNQPNHESHTVGFESGSFTVDLAEWMQYLSNQPNHESHTVGFESGSFTVDLADWMLHLSNPPDTFRRLMAVTPSAVKPRRARAP
jgi:hypothetical protein